MSDTGAMEQAPVRLVDRARVAEHQRQQHAAVTLLAGQAEDPVTQVAACAFDRVARRTHESLQADRRLVRCPHRAARPQIALEHPRFKIVSAGIQRSVRTL